MKQQTPHEIIDMVANHYNLTNRSTTTNGRCKYNYEGKQCAFAIMCIEPEKLEESKNASDLLAMSGMDILKPEYRGYSFEFYDQVQRFHDSKDNWTETGLSEQGVACVERLKREHQED